MLRKVSREKEEKLFIGRADYLKQLEDLVSKKNVVSLLAPAGFGRTTLLRRFASTRGNLYIDLKRLSLPPENFAVEFIGTICFLHLAGSPKELGEFLSLEKLKGLKLDPKCSEIIRIVDNELQKIKPDQELLIRSAFSFAECFAAGQKKRSIVVIDNFDELLKLDNFSQIKDAASTFFSAASVCKNSSFLVSSSSVSLMRSLLKQHPADIIELSPFSAEESRLLFEKIAGKVDSRIAAEAHRLSSGLPLIIKEMAIRFATSRSSDVQ